MATFFDADKFLFVEQEEGHLAPVHYRDLGLKSGALYKKSVSWSDVAINNVPLEQTFRYENEIDWVSTTQDLTPDPDLEPIIVNGRDMMDRNLALQDNDDDCPLKKKWLKRLEKMALQPMTLTQAKKKKKGPKRFQVKPKTETQRETDHHSSDKFQDLVDTKSPGILGSFIYTIRCKDGYEKRVSWDDGDGFGYNVSYIPKFKEKTYCPPEHWLYPVVQWKNIWLAMDEIEYGYKRDYVYVPEGELCPGSSSIMGPAISFFETKEEYKEHCISSFETKEDYEKYWAKRRCCWITGSHGNNNREFHSARGREISDSRRLSNTSYLSRVEKAYLETPSKETLKDYQDGWKLTQSGYKSWYQSPPDFWQFKACPGAANPRIVPQPHL